MPPQPPKRASRTPYLIALVLIAGLGAAVVIYSLSGWTASAKVKKLRNPVASTPAALAAGMDIYMAHCARCHGVTGDGKGDKSDQLSVAPADFADVQKWAGVTDGELYWQVTKGRDPMPGYEDSLSETQRWQVVDYIREFAAKARGRS
jgi:mono/diheme cytochrome c family protein